ncbi:hypothetical protein EV424DRAFT_1340848 [Suillus variegatus]|nr:hypothetical protein EV424DRAFT_1340848 [Suillus variegatus]
MFPKNLDRIVARVTLHLTPELGAQCAPEPLLGAWMMNYMWEYLVRTQICHWFKPLLDHFRRIGGRWHVMDNWSTVMLSNIVNDKQIVEHDTDIAVADIIRTYRQSFMMQLNNIMHNITPQLPARPKDKATFDAAVAKMGENKQVLYQALLTIVMKRKQRNIINLKNIAGEAHTIASIMGLHITAWDWASLYHPKLLLEPWVGALRRLIEMALAEYVQPLQTIGRSGLETTAEWTWWDELTISDQQADPQSIIETIEDKSMQEQHKLEEQLMLKQTHTDVIQKLVNHVTGLACAKSLSSPDTLMSADVSIGLEYLIQGIFLNTSRSRVRELCDKPNKKFNVSTDVEALDIIFPQCKADKFTMGYNDDYEDPEDHPEVTIHTSSGQNDKDLNVESEASANDQTRSSPPAIAMVAQVGDTSDQPATPTQAKVVSTDPDAMTVNEDSSNQHGQHETLEPQDETSISQSWKQAMVEDHIIHPRSISSNTESSLIIEDNGGRSIGVI